MVISSEVASTSGVAAGASREIDPVTIERSGTASSMEKPLAPQPASGRTTSSSTPRVLSQRKTRLPHPAKGCAGRANGHSPRQSQYVQDRIMTETVLTDDFTQSAEPYALFARWLNDATAAEPNDPNALALATVDPDGLPNVRMVLLKGFDEDGFVFYTNYESAKGREI